MSDSTATVNIPKDVLEPIIRQRVSADIVATLGDPGELIAKIVRLALAQKVDENGVQHKESYYNNHDLIETVAANAIRDVAREVLASWVAEQRPIIEEQIRKGLRRKESAFAKAIVTGLSDAMKADWSFNCNITMPKA